MNEKKNHINYKIGLNYISCSLYRVPIARLAAAQARSRDVLNESTTE